MFLKSALSLRRPIVVCDKFVGIGCLFTNKTRHIPFVLFCLPVDDMAIEESEPACSTGQVQETPALSEGAAVALGNVLSRVIPSADSSIGKTSGKSTGKRPRPLSKGKEGLKPVVLTENEETLKELAEDIEQRRRQKEHKRAKLRFQQNAHVIPDAATGVTLEKSLLTIATKGTVALFNAVAKAQKVRKDDHMAEKQKGPPVSKKAFLDMMKAGVEKSDELLASAEKSIRHESESEDDGAKHVHPQAKWLQDDFLTNKAKHLKDWDRPDDMADSSEGASDDDGPVQENADSGLDDDIEVEEDAFSEESDLEDSDDSE